LARQPGAFAGPVGEGGGGDLLQSRQVGGEGGREIDQGGAGRNLVVDQDERADRGEIDPLGPVDEMGGGVAVRLLEAAEQGMVDLLPRGMEVEAGESRAARELGMDGLAEADGSLGQTHHERGRGQVGQAGGKVAHRRAHAARRHRNVAAEHLGDDEEAALRVAARGEVAQRIERPVGAVDLKVERAGGEAYPALTNIPVRPELVEGRCFLPRLAQEKGRPSTSSGRTGRVCGEGATQASQRMR
jgi:hypothetical protein